jgi:predicted ATP-dependent serine protease
VCGGGIPPGCLLLLGGEPGVGKTTLLLQVAAVRRPAILVVGTADAADGLTGMSLRGVCSCHEIETTRRPGQAIAASQAAGAQEGEEEEVPRVLYTSGEETMAQVGEKASRLFGGVLPPNLDVLSETSVERMQVGVLCVGG